jgi:hypothetical protein
MSDTERNLAQGNGETPAAARDARKPYQKPSFRFEQVFETMALQCGKVNPTQAGCGSVRQAS